MLLLSDESPENTTRAELVVLVIKVERLGTRRNVLEETTIQVERKGKRE